MPREDFNSGDRVQNQQTNQWGTVVEDHYGVCAPEEVPVQYDDEEGYIGTDPNVLLKQFCN